MKYLDQDTIVAIATASGFGSLSVVRLSGPKAIEIADGLFEAKSQTPVNQQRSYSVQYGVVFEQDDKGCKKRLDEALLLVMRGPKSYTRQDVVEISTHGGVACADALLRQCLKLGARMALAGEFTKRAFLNGRIDLSQAEAVLGLIEAKTDLDRRFNSLQLEGKLSQKCKAIKEDFINLLGHLEASVDFPDDEIDPRNRAETASYLSALIDQLNRWIRDSRMGFLAKKGIRVVICGRPNVGKSSLLNALCQKNRAIVTPIAGTTRDTVEETIVLSGIAITLIDTAGIRESSDEIEKQGVDRSKQAIKSADIALFVFDQSQGWTSQDQELWDKVKALFDDKEKLTGEESYLEPAWVYVGNKADLPCALRSDFVDRLNSLEIPYTTASSFQENGTDKLIESISSVLKLGEFSLTGESVLNTSRQKLIIEKTLEHLQRALDACQQGLSEEFISADIRLAMDNMGQLTGEVVNDQILDMLFSRFCIGK